MLPNNAVLLTFPHHCTSIGQYFIFFDKCSADVNLMLYETHSVMTIYIYFRLELILFGATMYSVSCWAAVFKKVLIEGFHIYGCYCNWLAIAVWAYSLSLIVIYT